MKSARRTHLGLSMKTDVCRWLSVLALSACAACFNTTPPDAVCTSDDFCPPTQHCDVAFGYCADGAPDGGSGGGSAGGSAGGSGGGSAGGSAGGSGGGSAGGFTLGGTISGSTGGTMILRSPDEPDLSVLPQVSSSGASFVFQNTLSNGSVYDVTVVAQPSSANSCTVSHGSGVVNGANVTSVVVNCVPATWQAVAAGLGHSLALRTDGTLWAWGDNSNGQLGNGTVTQQSTPVQIGSGYVAISAGYYHSAALQSDGTLVAWGSNSNGQLGMVASNGNPAGDSHVPVAVDSSTTWSSISAGAYHTLAAKSDGSAYGWGKNVNGQVGSGTTAQVNTPDLIGTGFVSIAAGLDHSAAMRGSGAVYTWGNGAEGELGDDGDGGSVAQPQVIAGLSSDGGSSASTDGGTATITAGACHSLAVEPDGSLWSWGCNSDGQLGDGTYDDSFIPLEIGAGYLAVAPGPAAAHSMALTAAGVLYGWGNNSKGQLGLGSSCALCAATSINTPALVGSGYAAVAVGGLHTLAIKSDGTLWAWGYNGSGQLGTSSSSDSSAPVQIH